MSTHDKRTKVEPMQAYESDATAVAQNDKVIDFHNDRVPQLVSRPATTNP